MSAPKLDQPSLLKTWLKNLTTTDDEQRKLVEDNLRQLHQAFPTAHPLAFDDLPPVAKRLISKLTFDQSTSEIDIRTLALQPTLVLDCGDFVLLEYPESSCDLAADKDPSTHNELVEVEDEHFQQRQPGADEDEGDYTDTDSEISNDSDFDPTRETFTDRLWALRDIIPPTTRSWFSGKFDTTKRVFQGCLFLAGRSVWSISVSALLIGVPFALCWAEEQSMIAMEQEMRQREQGQDLLTAGADGGDTATQVGLALGSEGGAQAKPAL